MTAVPVFATFLLAALTILWWAAGRNRSARDFHAAGGAVGGLSNGLALAGNYISVASFLGVAGLVYADGYDGLVYAVSWLIGWPLMLVLVAERLRNLGRYTFADVASYRLNQGAMRSLAACGTLATVLLYLVAQMVAAGQLMQLLFDIPYAVAVIVIGVLMVVTVGWSGRLATGWVQVIKAVLLLLTITGMAMMVLWQFGFDLEALLRQAVRVHPKVLAALAAGATPELAAGRLLGPGPLTADPISALSLAMALMFGTAGLPHILMRFFTVADSRQARNSVVYATGVLAWFYAMTVIVGFGAIALIMPDRQFMVGAAPGEDFDPIFQLHGGPNMAAVQLAQALGGPVFFGFVSAVALVAILAMVSGLTLAAASAVSHDLYAATIARGRASESREVAVSKSASLVVGVAAVLLALAFERENVAFMVGLAFVIAASANFPILVASIFWSRLTTRGALLGGWLGLVSAVVLVILGPAVWCDGLGYRQAIFPYANPGLFSISLAFFGLWLGSVGDRSSRAGLEVRAFRAQFVRAELGPLGKDRLPALARTRSASYDAGPPAEHGGGGGKKA